MTDLAEKRAEFTDALESRIDAALQEFQDLELNQMRKGEIKARAKLADAKKLIDEERANARKSLSSARRASAAAWDEAKTGLQAAATELHAAVKRARADFAGKEEAQKV
jgi:hypothetical protein